MKKGDIMPDFEKNLRDQLKNSTDHIFPSDYAKNKIDLEIKDLEKNRGGIFMKLSKKIKLATALVLSLAFVGAGVYAVGNLTGTISHSPSTYTYTNYQDKDKALKEVGFEASIPQAISSYTFDGITVSHTADVDDEGRTFNQRKDLDITYKNEDGKVLDLFIDKRGPGSSRIGEEAYQVTKDINGRTFYYSQLESVFLSDPSQASPEELKRAEEDPFFNLSYGGAILERTESLTSHLSVEDEGVTYSFMVEGNLAPDQFFLLAQDLFQ